jgi:hypothetical protein
MFWKKKAAEDKNDEEQSQESLEIRAEVPERLDPNTSSTDPNNTSHDEPPGPNVCVRFTSELSPCQPWFSVVDRATGRKVDIPESFAPATCKSFLAKLLLGGFSLGTLIYTWVISEYPYYYLAYLTNWNLLMSVLYFVFSITNTMLAAWTPQPPDTLPACSRIRWTWILYEIALHSEVLVSIMFWALVYKPGSTVTFQTVAPHCAVAAAVWIDGTFVNRIPLRLMHWFGVIFPWDCLMVLWLVIQAFAGVGNPYEQDYDKDPDTTDDTLYQTINWKDSPLKSGVISLVVVLGIGPALFVILWWASLYTIPCLCRSDRRIYTDTVGEKDRARPTVSDVEEGSLFATWR